MCQSFFIVFRRFRCFSLYVSGFSSVFRHVSAVFRQFFVVLRRVSAVFRCSSLVRCQRSSSVARCRSLSGFARRFSLVVRSFAIVLCTFSAVFCSQPTHPPPSCRPSHPNTAHHRAQIPPASIDEKRRASNENHTKNDESFPTKGSPHITCK